MSGEGDGFLTRWSRLKRETAQVPEAETKAPEQAEEAVSEEDFDPAKLEIPLPSLDDLKPGDTLLAFMQKGVPETLRNAALRKMWALDPMVRDFRSEALDYAWDWNTPGGVPVAGPLGEADKVEEMVDAIFRQFEGPGDIAPREPAEPPAAEVPDAEMVKKPPEPQPDPAAAEPPAITEGEATPRRRHGGAMPQV